MKLKTIIWLIILVLVVMFAFQNTKPSTLSVYFWSFESPLIIVILFSLAIGFLAGIFLRNIRREEKEKIKKDLEKEKEKQGRKGIKGTRIEKEKNRKKEK